MVEMTSHQIRNRSSKATASDLFPDDVAADGDEDKNRPNKKRENRVVQLMLATSILVSLFAGTPLLLFQPWLLQDGRQIFAVVDEDEESEFMSCRYDGHCPVGTTCAMPSSKRQSLVGVCEPIVITNTATATEACLRACQAELELDEHFYQEEWPVVEFNRTVTSAGRPAGCVLGYHREPERHRWKDREQQKPPLLDEWMAQRFRYVIRVDPRDPHDEADKTWISYCFNPCQTNADCATRKDGNEPGFVCQKGVCQRNPVYWENTANDGDKSEMVIVTAATSDYFHGLSNLAASAEYWAPNTSVVVYNLGGIDQNQRKEILSWKNVIALEWPDGVPQHYPEHVKQGRIYAWKPIIINETLTKYKSIFWLDAGSTLAGPITPTEKILHRTGMFLVKGQDLSMYGKSFPKTFEWFNTTKETLQIGPHYSGNTQAHFYPSRYYETVVALNAKCALDATCISPPDSSLGNHRYDQTTLSIASYHPKVRAPHYTEYLAATRDQLSDDLLKPSSKFVWTARQGEQFYSSLLGR